MLSQQQQSTAQSLHELHGLVATQSDALRGLVAAQSDALRGLVAAQSDALRDLSDVQICSIQEMLRDVVRKGRDVHRNRTRSVIKMDFLFQIPEVWTSWASILDSTKEDERIRARLVLVPFLHDAHYDSNRSRRFLAGHGYSFVDWSAYDLDRDSPDVVFLQNPYDSTRPASLSTHAFISRGIRIAYVPYGLDVGGGEENLKYQYDLDVQRNAWRIFARSPQHKRLFGLYCGTGNEHVIVTGHPRFDQLIDHEPRPLTAAIKNAAEGRRIVLWCPHFTVGGTGWSTFDRYSGDLLSFFEDQTNLTLLVRPHPLFFGRLRDKVLMTKLGELALRRRFSNPPNIVLDESESYLGAFAASDALMADAGSFLLEYLPTTKPILYLENPDGPGLNESGAFTSQYYRAGNFDEIRRFISMVAEGEDPGREERLRLVSEELVRIDGQIGKSIKNHVVEAIVSETDAL